MAANLIRFKCLSEHTPSAVNICTYTMAAETTSPAAWLQGITQGRQAAAEWTAGQAQQSVPKTDITLSSGIKNEPVGQIAVRVRAAERQRGAECVRERASECERKQSAKFIAESPFWRNWWSEKLKDSRGWSHKQQASAGNTNVACAKEREGEKQGERESETTAATNCKKCRALATPQNSSIASPARGELPPLVACCFLLLYFCAFSSTRRLNLKSSWECAYIPLTSRARTHTHPHTHIHTHRECGSHLNANATTGNETDNATYLSLYLRLWFRLWLQAISLLFLLLLCLL